jgi:hypothetical protein
MVFDVLERVILGRRGTSALIANPMPRQLDLTPMQHAQPPTRSAQQASIIDSGGIRALVPETPSAERKDRAAGCSYGSPHDSCGHGVSW